jgi:hypothetical protein
MSTSPSYTYDLIDSDTMESIVPQIGGMSGRSFKPVFNGAGSFSFTVPLDSRTAFNVRRHKTGILITRRDSPIWSGKVTNIVKSAAARTCAITTTGWLDELDKRFVRKDEETALNFGTATVGGEIIQALIAAVNAQEDTGSITRPLRIRPGVVQDTQTRTRSFKQGDSYGAGVREMIEIENGCDIYVDPLTKQLDTRPPTAYSDLTAVKFGYGVSPHNLEDVVENDDADTVRNRFSVVAANGLVYLADDPMAIDAAGVMLEEWISLSDVSDPTGTIPAAYANAELVYKRYGTVSYTLTPKKFGNMPRPYDDFQWGDKGYLSIDQDSLQVQNLGVRIFSATITHDENNNEIISDLQVTLS